MIEVAIVISSVGLFFFILMLCINYLDNKLEFKLYSKQKEIFLEKQKTDTKFRVRIITTSFTHETESIQPSMCSYYPYSKYIDSKTNAQIYINNLIKCGYYENKINNTFIPISEIIQYELVEVK